MARLARAAVYFDASTLPWLLRWLPRASIIRVAWDGLLRHEFHALERLGVVPSAAELLAEHGVASANAAAATALHATRRRKANRGEGAAPVGGVEMFELVRITAILLAAAYIALAAKAPRFHALGAGGAAKPKRD